MKICSVCGGRVDTSGVKCIICGAAMIEHDTDRVIGTTGELVGGGRSTAECEQREATRERLVKLTKDSIGQEAMG
jgi:hypothetical protein